MGWPARSATETPVVSSPVPANEVNLPSESVVQSRAGIRSRRERSDERDGQRPGNCFSGQNSSRKSCIGLIVCLGRVRSKWAGVRLGSRVRFNAEARRTRRKTRRRHAGWCGEVELLFHGEL
jgi:hypothetical protein